MNKLDELKDLITALQKKEEEKQIVNKEETKLTLFQRIINLFK